MVFGFGWLLLALGPPPQKGRYIQVVAILVAGSVRRE
jgi:hypothetical protein